MLPANGSSPRMWLSPHDGEGSRTGFKPGLRVLAANSPTGCSAEKHLSRGTASAPGGAAPFAATRGRF
jgi:hypothetical protein